MLLKCNASTCSCFQASYLLCFSKHTAFQRNIVFLDYFNHLRFTRFLGKQNGCRVYSRTMHSDRQKISFRKLYQALPLKVKFISSPCICGEPRRHIADMSPWLLQSCIHFAIPRTLYETLWKKQQDTCIYQSRKDNVGSSAIHVQVICSQIFPRDFAFRLMRDNSC